MVCIPCIVAPVLLYIWYRFIQPIVLKFWNPWAPKQAIKTSDAASTTSDNEKKSACPFSTKSEVNDTASCEKELVDKKID